MSRLTTGVASSLLFLSCSLVWADEREELVKLRDTTLNLIELLVEQGVLTKENADSLVKRAESSAAAASNTSPVPEPTPTDNEAPPELANEVDSAVPGNPNENIIRVPYVPEFVKKEIREDLKKEVLAQAKSERWGDPGSFPEWTQRISFDGDIRLRYEEHLFDQNNGFVLNTMAINEAGTTDIGTPTLYTRANDDELYETRDRYRVRLRLGMKAQIADDLLMGLRMTTGSFNNPVSANQTLGGSPDSRYNFFLDQVYLKYTPTDWATLWAGRIPNPWFFTDLVWNNNLNFDGLAANLHHDFNPHLTGFATLGLLPIEEIEFSSNDKWLLGGQVGLHWKPNSLYNLKVGIAYYDYQNIQGVRNPLQQRINDYTAPEFVQKGNTLFNIRNNPLDANDVRLALASDFNEFNVTGTLDITAFDPIHVMLSADFVKNLAFDRDEILANPARYPFTHAADISGDLAYLVNLTVGRPQMEKLHDWQVFATYRYLESDSLLDAYTDTNFHLGGTNTKGWILGASYGVTHNSWLTIRWFTGDEINNHPGTIDPFDSTRTRLDAVPLGIDVLLVDLNARF